MKRIELDCYGIVVETDGKGGGSISSDLHEGSPDSNDFDCAMDGIESLTLAHACAGIDIESPAYIEGIETAVQAAGNHY